MNELFGKMQNVVFVKGMNGDGGNDSNDNNNYDDDDSAREERLYAVYTESTGIWENIFWNKGLCFGFMAGIFVR